MAGRLDRASEDTDEPEETPLEQRSFQASENAEMEEIDPSEESDPEGEYVPYSPILIFGLPYTGMIRWFCDLLFVISLIYVMHSFSISLRDHYNKEYGNPEDETPMPWFEKKPVNDTRNASRIMF